MVVGLLGNESPDSNRFTLVTPKPENGVRLQATLDNQNPTGLPVGAVRLVKENIFLKLRLRLKFKRHLEEASGRSFKHYLTMNFLSLIVRVS